MTSFFGQLVYLIHYRRLFPSSINLIFQIYLIFIIFQSSKLLQCNLLPILNFLKVPINIKSRQSSFPLKFCHFMIQLLLKYFTVHNRIYFIVLFSIHFYKQINLQQAIHLFHFFQRMTQDVSLRSSSQHLHKDCFNLNSNLEFQRSMTILILNQKFNHTMIFNNLNNNVQFQQNRKLY